MVACGAHGCTNRTEKNPGLSFHVLPQNKDLREKWLANIKRVTLPKKLAICDEHFEAECFERDLKVKRYYVIIPYVFFFFCGRFKIKFTLFFQG